MELLEHPQGTMRHDDLILCDLRTEQLLGEVSGRVYIQQSQILHSSLNSLITHRYSQDVRKLVCFCLSEAVPCICDKNNWHHKLSLRVNQLLERLFCGRD